METFIIGSLIVIILGRILYSIIGQFSSSIFNFLIFLGGIAMMTCFIIYQKRHENKICNK